MTIPDLLNTEYAIFHFMYNKAFIEATKPKNANEQAAEGLEEMIEEVANI